MVLYYDIKTKYFKSFNVCLICTLKLNKMYLYKIWFLKISKSRLKSLVTQENDGIIIEDVQDKVKIRLW